MAADAHHRRRDSLVNRRSLLKAAALGAGATLAAPAISKSLREWRMVTSWPKGLPGLGTGAERLAANINALSGGRLRVKVYAAGELVPALECFGAVANGTAQLGHDGAVDDRRPDLRLPHGRSLRVAVASLRPDESSPIADC